MSDQQLTVAELLARSGKDKKTSGRRRRRSLEEGGVSIAELTGNIPKVEATPVAGKHNTESIEGVDRDQAVTVTAGDKQAGTSEQTPHAADAVAVGKQEEQTPEAAKSAADDKTPAAEKPAADEPEAPRPAAEKSAPTDAGPKFGVPKTAKLEAVPAPAKPVAQATPGKAAADKNAPAQQAPTAQASKPAQKPAQPQSQLGQPSVANDETVILSVVDENDPVRLTTGTFPAVKGGKSSTEVNVSELAASAEVAKPAQPEQPAPSVAAPKSAPRTPELAEPAELSPEVAAALTPAVDEASAGETTTFNAVPADADAVPATADSVEVAEIEDADGDEDNVPVSVGAIILQALLGVALGVVVFAGFQFLWGNLGRGIVAVLAAIVAVLIIFVVNKVNSAHDRLLTVLSALVAIVLTFGPLLTV